MLQQLLPEHVTLVSSYLDGDSYVNLGQTNKDNWRLFNDQLFLEEIFRLNRYPFVVLDAKYYAYCYARYFLTGHKIDVQMPILRVVLRTLKRGKMTQESVNTLRVYMTELKSVGKQREDNDRLWTKISALLALPNVVRCADLHPDLTALTADASISALYICTKPSPVTNDNLASRLIAACAKNKHELVSQLLDGDCEKLKSLSADFFLSGKSDAITTAKLLAFSGRPVSPDRMAFNFIVRDNAEALRVLLEFCTADKAHLMRFSLHECCEFDAVKCFAVFAEYNYAGLPKVIVDESVVRNRAYGISRYYNIQPTIGTKITGFLIDAAISTFKWALGV